MHCHIVVAKRVFDCPADMQAMLSGLISDGESKGVWALGGKDGLAAMHILCDARNKMVICDMTKLDAFQLITELIDWLIEKPSVVVWVNYRAETKTI